MLIKWLNILNSILLRFPKIPAWGWVVFTDYLYMGSQPSLSILRLNELANNNTLWVIRKTNIACPGFCHLKILPVCLWWSLNLATNRSKWKLVNTLKYRWTPWPLAASRLHHTHSPYVISCLLAVSVLVCFLSLAALHSECCSVNLSTIGISQEASMLIWPSVGLCCTKPAFKLVASSESWCTLLSPYLPEHKTCKCGHLPVEKLDNQTGKDIEALLKSSQVLKKQRNSTTEKQNWKAPQERTKMLKQNLEEKHLLNNTQNFTNRQLLRNTFFGWHSGGVLSQCLGAGLAG